MENSEHLRMRVRNENTIGSPHGVLAVSAHLGDTVAITEAARRLGIPSAVATTPEAALASYRAARPTLVVVDLTLPGAVALVEGWIADRTPMLGFYPHIDRDLRERALRAGLQRVVPRSAFFKRLPELLASTLEARLPEPPPGC